jgi:hypothetical protein
MPDLVNHQSAQTTKMLFLGPNGSGKTGGSVCSLASAGYNVRVLDLDNGLDIVKNILTSEKGKKLYGPEAATRVKFETVTDPMKNVAGRLVPSKATVWQRVAKLLNNWSKTEGASDDLGPISGWTSNEVLIIDSCTTLANGAMNFVLSMNARLGQQPHQSDWYQGQQLLESLFQMLFDEGVKCNIIINCHIVYIGEEGREVGYPATLGKALSPKMGSYFNTIVLAKTTGQGAAERHKIITKSTGGIELKNSAPLDMAAEYPIEDGMAQVFRVLRGQT